MAYRALQLFADEPTWQLTLPQATVEKRELADT
jgi:hypothetical protein